MTQDHSKPPSAFVCLMTGLPMKEPMMSRHGKHYERSAVLEWINNGNYFCPITRKPLRPSFLVSDKNLAWKIKCWAKETGYQWPQSAATTATVGKGNLHHPELSGRSSHSSQASETEAMSSPSSSFRSDRSSIVDDAKSDPALQVASEMFVSFEPDRFICPLTHRVMKDPVMSRTGVNYERRAILDHLDTKGYECPVTKKTLMPSGIVANCKLNHEITHWMMNHGKVYAEDDSESSSYEEGEVEPHVSKEEEETSVPPPPEASQKSGIKEATKASTKSPEATQKTIVLKANHHAKSSPSKSFGLSKHGSSRSMSLRVPITRLFAINGGKNRGNGKESTPVSTHRQDEAAAAAVPGLTDVRELSSVLDDVLETIAA